MTTLARPAGADVHDLTDQEAREILDQAARRYLGMSGEEFLRRYNAGELDDHLEEPKVHRVAALIRLIR